MTGQENNKMLLSILAVFWLPSHITATIYIYTETFAIMPVCTDDYGTTLGTYEFRSQIECYLRCTQDPSCKSVVYDYMRKICTTNAARISSFTEECAITESFLRYGAKPVQNTMGIICTGNSECDVTNSECRDGLCQCQPGYSYQQSTVECVDYCTEYGATFHEHKQHVLSGYNEDSITVTVEDCQTLCLEAVTFICRTYEFNWSSGKCYLQSDTALSQPQSYSYSDIYSVFQRNCQ